MGESDDEVRRLVADEVERTIAEMGLSMAAFADEVSVSYNVIRALAKPDLDRSYQPKTLTKVSVGLGREPHWLSELLGRSTRDFSIIVTTRNEPEPNNVGVRWLVRMMKRADDLDALDEATLRIIEDVIELAIQRARLNALDEAKEPNLTS